MTSHEEIHARKVPATSTGHDGAEAPHKLPMRTLIAASVGNAVEWYDWTVYATFSIYFATQIFPAENESLALIGTFATYALAFFFRPLGGSLLGRYADLMQYPTWERLGRGQAPLSLHQRRASHQVSRVPFPFAAQRDKVLSFMAEITACVRFVTPNLRMIRRTCTLTVASDMPSLRAINLFVCP